MNLFLIWIATSAGGLLEVLKYFAFTLSDGDYMNDWLTHVPVEIADACLVLGKWLASVGA